jgi:hypothetical protein
MRNVSLIAVLVAAIVMAVGCSSGTAPTSDRTATSGARSQVPFPSPIPTQPPTACGSGSSPCLAVVSLRGTSGYVVRDVTDIAHGRTVGAPRLFGTARFVNASEVSYIEATFMVRASISGSDRNMVNLGLLNVTAFAWSPDGSGLAVLGYNNQYNTEVHLVRGSRDQLLATATGLPDVTSVPCGTQTCIDHNDLELTYSPDGGLIMWRQNTGSKFRVWTATGVDVTPSLGTPSMAVWSGSSLFFQDSKGIEVLLKGTVSAFLPGVKWIRPNASPMGGQIVYESRDTTGLAHVYIVDTATAVVRDLGAGRAEPAFLTSRFIWYQGERVCTSSESCDSGTPVKPTGKTYIYDLQDLSESSSIITSVLDIWPRAA